jgi:hypothetical protein
MFWQLAVQFALLAGFFEFIRVKAYEEDQEEMKARLERIEALLNGSAPPTDHQERSAGRAFQTH